ncbi:hypothetical protein [Teichococcus vastitatis]|uniref:Uncharacterized protein n=1 Tax=Teichococcus vastitatis TaxID=2307076 RepID=A0ABS9W8D0_9PROT|nr:hypothetical protein [Pseudoroseomonas vastitatis]MCI0755557.1 hypothetical protein [Pseudoroseomonas vastitatis]
MALLLLYTSSFGVAKRATIPDHGENVRSAISSRSSTDADGVPLRPLSNEELHRLLLAPSVRSAVATRVLVNCHTLDRPYGHPDWRQCLMDRTSARP